MFDNLLNRGLTGGDTDPMLQQAFFEAPMGAYSPWFTHAFASSAINHCSHLIPVMRIWWGIKTASGFLIGEVFGRGRSPLKLFTSLDAARIVFYIVNDRIRQSIAVVKHYLLHGYSVLSNSGVSWILPIFVNEQHQISSGSLFASTKQNIRSR